MSAPAMARALHVLAAEHQAEDRHEPWEPSDWMCGFACGVAAALAEPASAQTFDRVTRAELAALIPSMPPDVAASARDNDRLDARRARRFAALVAAAVRAGAGGGETP